MELRWRELVAVFTFLGLTFLYFAGNEVFSSDSSKQNNSNRGLVPDITDVTPTLAPDYECLNPPETPTEYSPFIITTDGPMTLDQFYKLLEECGISGDEFNALNVGPQVAELATKGPVAIVTTRDQLNSPVDRR